MLRPNHSGRHKVEFYDRYLLPTKAAAKLAVGDWIERVYNRRRRRSGLGMISPVDFEDRLKQTAKSRLTLCSPNGVKPTDVTAVLARRRVARQSTSLLVQSEV